MKDSTKSSIKKIRREELKENKGGQEVNQPHQKMKTQKKRKREKKKPNKRKKQRLKRKLRFRKSSQIEWNLRDNESFLILIK